MVTAGAFQGKTLVSQMRVGPIPPWTLAYCLRDAGGWFHIKTATPFLGAFEFTIMSEHRESFLPK